MRVRYSPSLSDFRFKGWDTSVKWNVTYGGLVRKPGSCFTYWLFLALKFVINLSKVDVAPDSAVRLSVMGGGLGDEFFLNSFHFHWSEASGKYLFGSLAKVSSYFEPPVQIQGSEHMINGNSYAAEVHFVHTSKSGKQAVLGFMLEVSPSTSR